MYAKKLAVRQRKRDETAAEGLKAINFYERNVFNMSIKYQVLKLLEDNKGSYISGNYIAGELSVSRASVWKTIVTLRSEGYGISAVTNKGYCLEKSGDLLSTEGILRHIKTEGVFIVETKKLVTSTNTLLLTEAARGAPEGYVLAAEAQTHGKGRQGRGFFSPEGHGAYFSVVLRPEKHRANDAHLITAAAAVAAARAIEEIFNVKVGIKWVNDLYVKGKKICGILTEATVGMENNVIDSAVLGIGINVTKAAEGYPQELKGIADAIANRTQGRDNERCRLIAATLDNFWDYYKDLSKRAFLDEYRKRSILLGKTVSVQVADGAKSAKVLSVDDECGLVVRYDDGNIATLNSGEVSVGI